MMTPESAVDSSTTANATEASATDSVVQPVPDPALPTPPRSIPGKHGGFLIPWVPGQRGNPRGAAAPLVSLAAEIRRQTGSGRELAALYLAIMRGEPIKCPGTNRKSPKNAPKLKDLWVRPTLEHRMQAAEWLANRGWGKAKETIELTGEASPAQRLELLRRLSEPERLQLRAILARALTGESNGTSIPADASVDEPANAHLEGRDSVEF
jgi:hypothetical protein